MNGLLKVLGMGKGQGEPVDPATAPPPKYNPLWMNAEAYDKGVQDRAVRQGQMQANGINQLIAGGDLQGARTKALGYGNAAAVTQIDAMLDKMTERQLAEAKRYGGIIAGTLQPLLDVPEADRPQYEGKVKARLLAQGVPENMLSGLDLTDYGIQSELNIALGLDKRMEGRAFTEMGDQLVLSDKLTGTADTALTRDPAYAEVTTRTNNEVTAAETARANRAKEAIDRQNAATAAANAAKPSAEAMPKLSDVKGIRETNEKRFQAFEEAQRQYQTMGKLANDGTGASDVALGFAFFKTIDPSSTVREGEFAAAASSMGLGAQAVAAFERLDSGQKFSPQLRRDLLTAAGHAFDLQKRDIAALVERERAFAQRYGLNPDDIARDPVVAGDPFADLPPGATPVAID